MPNFPSVNFGFPKYSSLVSDDNKGILVESAKIESLKIGHLLRPPTGIHQFLGLAGYYLVRFSEGFQRSPNHDQAHSKGSQVWWGDKQKQLRCLREGFGRVCMQREKVISYASRQLKIHEKNLILMICELGGSSVRSENLEPLSVGTTTEPENIKNEDVSGMLIENANIRRQLERKSWNPFGWKKPCASMAGVVTCYGDLRTVIMLESHKSSFLSITGSEKNVSRR
ncbi:hypothetical protein Tco_1054050 [Tanacetum coccineum]|uniref:Uncharacterized protein n=1 Tax=Tanacetum coccineum TaxID=301880 RepID=A0ABQ5GVN4_9ASTR